MTDPEDVNTINELTTYTPGEAFEEYSYNLDAFAGSEDLVYLYWKMNVREFSYFSFEYLIIAEGNASSVDQALLKETKVYPNPSNSNIVFSGPLLMETIEIYNQTGQLVRQQNVNQFEHTIDVRDFNAGLYSAMITTENGQIMKMFVVE